MMNDRGSWIIIGSTLALVTLIGFQVSWLNHSRNLIETQFEQKVTMAMCKAVESLRDSNDSIKTEIECGMATPACGTECVAAYLSEDPIRDALVDALRLYDIDMDFYFDVLPATVVGGNSNLYCSPMESITNDDQMLSIFFKEKEAYILDHMEFMTGSSIFILLFVGSLLLLISFKLIRQKQMHKMSIAFFNNMAHEFRTPLTNIRLATNLIQRRQPDLDPKFLKIIRGEQEHLFEQVERILHIANFSNGNFLLELEELDLVELLEDLEKNMQLQLQQKGGQMIIEYDDSLPVLIEADRLHLMNAFQNLIDNSIKYSQEAPEIEVKIEVMQEKVWLQFRDNGPGIPSQAKKWLFQPFMRGYKENIYTQKGFGLGLAYTKEVIALHGGGIKLNEHIQNGTQFDLWFPL